MQSLPQHVSAYRDRHGQVRYRYRKGKANISLGTDPNSDDFQLRFRIASGTATEDDLRRIAPKSATWRQKSFIAHWVKGKKSRTKRGDVSDLDKDYLHSVLKDQGWRCAITGLDFEKYERKGRPFQISLDRIDPKRGYIRGNVRFVFLGINIGLNNWGISDYLELASAAVEHASSLPKEGGGLGRTATNQAGSTG